MKNDIDFTTEYDEDFFNYFDEEDEQENDDFDADIHFPWPYYTHTNHRSYKAKKDYTCYVTAGFATAFLICLSFIMLSKGALEQFPLTSYLVVIGQMLGFIALLPLSYKKFMARIKLRNIDLSDIAATEYDSGKNYAVSALHWIKGVYFGVVPMTFGTAILIPPCADKEFVIILTKASILFGVTLMMYMHSLAHQRRPLGRKLLRQNACLIAVSLILPVIQLVLYT